MSPRESPEEPESARNVSYPRKYWWVVLVVLPVMLAAIKVIPDVFKIFKPAETSTHGSVTIDNMVFISVNVIQQEYEKVYGAPLKDEELRQKILRASSLAKQGSYRDAIAILEEIAPNVNVGAIANNLGVLRAKIGDVEAARKSIEKAIEKNPNDKVFRNNAGIVDKLPINLLARENGGQVILAPNDNWWKTIDGREEGSGLVFRTEESAVYGFKNDQPATFDTFAVLIPASGYNLKEFEIMAGNASPVGKFDSIGKFTVVNAKFMKSPYQEFKFQAVTAKYLKVQLISSYHFNNWVELYEFRLLGHLKQ